MLKIWNPLFQYLYGTYPTEVIRHYEDPIKNRIITIRLLSMITEYREELLKYKHTNIEEDKLILKKVEQKHYEVMQMVSDDLFNIKRPSKQVLNREFSKIVIIIQPLRVEIYNKKITKFVD